MFLTNVINPLGLNAISLLKNVVALERCRIYIQTQGSIRWGVTYFRRVFRTITPKRLTAPRPMTIALSVELVLL